MRADSLLLRPLSRKTAFSESSSPSHASTESISPDKSAYRMGLVETYV